MRQSVIIGILVVLGLVAAVTAAVLVVLLQMPDTDQMQETATVEPEVTVLAAARELPPRTVLDATDMVEQQVPEDDAPANYFSNPAELQGRMLARPVNEGQTLTNRFFPAPGSGYELAADLPAGMRAVNVSVAGVAALDGLLYPGSVVDVLAEFSLGEGNLGSAMSATLLENVQVLAVENQTMTAEEDSESERAGDRANLRVTLMVTSEEAEAVQLAAEYGALSLALRNPQDEESIARDATLFNDGEMARFADVMGAQHRSAPSFTAPAADEPAPRTEVDILRGTETETKTFEDRR